MSDPARENWEVWRESHRVAKRAAVPVGHHLFEIFEGGWRAALEWAKAVPDPIREPAEDAGVTKGEGHARVLYDARSPKTYIEELEEERDALRRDVEATKKLNEELANHAASKVGNTVTEEFFDKLWALTGSEGSWEHPAQIYRELRERVESLRDARFRDAAAASRAQEGRYDPQEARRYMAERDAARVLVHRTQEDLANMKAERDRAIAALTAIANWDDKSIAAEIGMEHPLKKMARKALESLDAKEEELEAVKAERDKALVALREWMLDFLKRVGG